MLTSQRHLPHWYAIGQPLFVTFRLHGSLPCGREFPPQSTSSGEAFLCLDRLLDGARIGPTYLAMPSIAGIVADSMRHCSEIDYRLHAWVIMPNHVHLLATPRTDVSEFMRRIKGYTARQANALLHRTGQAFWQEESYDRLVRTPGEFTKIEAYILNNPAKAGLARSAAEYRWSSAYQGE
jgi:REP element-mobilizing transposase RayT